jgi:hypothetical protein
MISLKILSAAAIVTLALPVMDSTASFAQGGAQVRGAVQSRGGGGAPHFNGGGGGGPRFNGGGGGGGQRFSGGGQQFRGGGGGGGWNRGRGGGGFIPGAVAGAVIGGAIASQNYYNNGYGYGGGYGYGNSYAAAPYYDGPYDDGSAVVEVAPGGGGDDVGYCMQTYKSYDPQSGTYLGYDGLRHPCP